MKPTVPLDERLLAGLRALADRSPMTSRELAESLGLTGPLQVRATAAANIAIPLRRRGLVATSTAGWEITDEGRRVTNGDAR